jgi:hypothetical protein
MITFLSALFPESFTIGMAIWFVSLNIIEKFILKSNIFTESRSQDCFSVCDLGSCYLFAETNNFVLDAFLLSFLVSELLKPS